MPDSPLSAASATETPDSAAVLLGPPPGGETCAACGSPFEPHDRFCPACGRSVEAPAPADAADVPAPHELERAGRHFRCENCGAEVETDTDQRSYVCAFCDSTYVVELPSERSGRQRPEFVIGFSVTRDQAREKFRTWLADRAWFRPGDLASAEIAEKLRGVYLPFWSFAMFAQSRWSAAIGEYWYETETYTTTENGKTVTKTRQVQRTEWWNLSGNHHKYYSGYLVSGSRGLGQSEADRIGPYQMPALKRYAPYFLAGWLSEEYSVDREAAMTLCREQFARRNRRLVAAFLPGDTHRDLNVETQFSQSSSDLILLPVFLLSYKYKDRLYRFLVNGQTGKVAGERPISWLRIGAAVATVLLLVALVVLLGILSQR